MATAVFTAIGNAIGGPIGGAIGAMIGGLIDQELFGPGDQEGPRLSDLGVTTSTYGRPIPLIYGPENRAAGNIIWSTGLIESSEEEGGKGGGPSFTTFTYRSSYAIALSGRQTNKLKRIWANNKVIYDASAILDFSPNHTLPPVDPVNGQIVTKYFLDETQSPTLEILRGTHFVMDEVRFYPGNLTQTPDSFMESIEGVGEVPAYRGVTYVVIKDLQLADFGNRTPNFEFELEADEAFTVGAAVKDITDRADIENASVVGLNDNLRGFVLARQSPVFRAVLPLAVAYNFETTEQRGQIRYVKRSLGMKGSIPVEQMGARPPTFESLGSSPREHLIITEVIMPDEVSITFKDPALDYQPNTQTANRREGSAVNKIPQELPLVFSADEARKIADRLLWGAWSNKRAQRFSVSDTWVRLNPGDLVGLTFNDETIPYKIVRYVRGNNGIIELDATYEDPEIYNSNATGIPGLSVRNELSVVGETLFVMIDGPLLNDNDSDSGFYWAATAESDGWRGAELQRSNDSGSTFSKFSDIAVKNPIGQVSGILAAGNTVQFDRATTLTVTLTSSENSLESVSELLVLNGSNAAWVGSANGGEGEIIQFATATLIAQDTYELTDLLRGRLGTEYAVDSHVADEVFVLLQITTTGKSDFGVNDWFKSRLYKPVSFLTDAELTASQSFTNTGIRAKPLSPSQVQGTRDTSDNLTITWLRRSRLRAPGLGNGDPALGETTELYEIDIFDGATVVRTITITSETATYTAAEQTTDGLTPGDLVTIDVYQISETRNRGFAARATI